MSDWNTHANQLDANLTAIALRARSALGREGHFVQVRAWERQRRRERLLATATLWLTCLAVGCGLYWWWR